jgi:branched-chain amino acid transport system ATP-binding protein
MAASPPLLETNDLTVTFGGLVAVNAVSLHVAPGTLVGLIGPNGAGKTTFIDALTGIVPTSGGGITFGGTSLSGLPPHRRARAGLGRTWQSVQLFDDLTVRENAEVAAERTPWRSFLAGAVGRPRRELASVDWALGLLELGALAERLPGELSHGQRKLVGVARALADEPRMVCMDEPAAGLDSQESSLLGGTLRRIVDHGTTIFLVDHDMGLVLGVCDYIYVMEFGSLIAHGTPDEIRTNERVIVAYLGERARKDAAALAAAKDALDAAAQEQHG